MIEKIMIVIGLLLFMPLIIVIGPIIFLGLCLSAAFNWLENKIGERY